jgi:anti-sigma factor RsiW
MNACSEHHERLLDHAAGAPAAAELAAHLRACPACAQELERRRTRGAELEATVLRLANPEPSPYLAARILARAQAPQRPWRLRLVGFAAAAVVVALCAVAVWVVDARQERQAAAAAAAISNWRSPTASLLRPPSQPIFQSGQGVLP